MSRIRPLNDRPVRGDGRHVLYWMIAARRVESNLALERAIALARDVKRPLVILEALRLDYPFASDRLHRFVIEGMAANQRALADRPVTYLPYIEPERGAGRGLVAALAASACAVVTDDTPTFFLPRMLAAAAPLVPVRLEAVDSNGLLPMRAVTTEFKTAASFRRYLQRTWRERLADVPKPIDWRDLPPVAAMPDDLWRWPMPTAEDLAHPDRLIAALPIDHTVAAVSRTGGAEAARRVLHRFIEERLDRYIDHHNHPDLDGTSELSPYLHFGHISAHQIFAAVMTRERWTTRRLAGEARGAREGWWGVSPGAEAFLDQLVTWRELGLNLCVTRPDDYTRYESLPEWARATLDRHAADPRRPCYTRAQFEAADTHDAVWNAAQRQLLRDGWMHNYLRMLWGKKILEWSATPREALETMVAVMDRHAIDGRDPNSYAGYSWTLGRYDRPWGPVRPIFGTVRYMSSANTVKKLRMKTYLQRYA